MIRDNLVFNTCKYSTITGIYASHLNYRLYRLNYIIEPNNCPIARPLLKVPLKPVLLSFSEGKN